MKRTMKIAQVMGAVMGLSALVGFAVAQQEQPRSPHEPGQRMPGNASKGYIAAPPGSETLNTDLAEDSIQLFENDDFKGTESTVNNLTGTSSAGNLNELPNGLNDSTSALRWNLPPGLLVVLYEDAAGKGEQLLLWGKGQLANLHKCDFDNKASRWAWYDVGGGAGGYSSGAMARPHGSQNSTASIPADTIQLFIDKDFKNTMQQVSPLTGQKAGELNTLPSGIGDSLTALRWNLPEGVIVMFYQDASGKKQQVGVWGQGEVADLDIWDFNDKASRWSWAYIGTPSKAPGSPNQPPASPRQPSGERP